MQNDWKNTFGGAAVVLGVALVLSSIIAASAFVASRSLGNTLSATGSAKQRVSADTAKWVVRAERITTPDAVAAAYTQVANDTARIKKYLTQAGVPASEITTQPVAVEDYYGPGYDNTRRVAVRQSVIVQSKDVTRVQSVAQNTIVLAQQGVQFVPMPPEYLVSTLPELRIALLGEAVKDAQKRAGEIAKATGQRIGKLTTSSSGVVQVLAPDSIDVSDYGSYDTSSVEKDVMVTVRGTFVLK